MKKIIFSVLAILLSIVSFAQVSQSDRIEALSLVKSNLNQIGLSANDYNNLDVSSSYLIGDANIRMVYLIQTFKGIQVFNKMQVLAFKNGKLVSSTGGRINQIEQLVNVTSATPSIHAATALATVLSDQQISTNEKIVPLKQIAGKTYFGNLNISTVDISAELVWLPINAKEIRLTWQIEIAPIKSSDHYLIRVDAVTNRVIDKNNYTVYEQFEQLKSKEQVAFENVKKNTVSNQSLNVVTSATMRVVPYPAESPLHVGGSHALVTDPWNWAPGNATSLLWNYDGTTYRDSTRGNNVWAQEDRDNNNATYGKAAVSSTPQPSLTLNYTPDYTQAPTVAANQAFATTNLFYWNNLMHDLMYKYGFDEVSGNFQANNQSRGGLGNDYVVADAQDAGGTNNANFSTPVDGSLPRMQMYLFNYTTPNRDGDLDNGIIAHEYGHGISNRLTGGPANSSCLSNAEQGGEGWSDFMSLMTSTDWTIATVNDGSISRPIGTYAIGQGTTGAGIRTYPYSTNMSVNPWTYGMMAGSGGQVHKIGEIWCSVLWDMTWEMIALDGINRNFFDPNGIGGNSAAMKLVVEGMRLQPCSPGYIDARNAILKADTLFFGAKYSCAIWKAFARRGMGKFASQGSSSSTTDQIADFTDNGGSLFLLTQSVTQQQEGQNVTYNHYVSAGNCSAISNYTIRDTLPSNVTYVSGGTYDEATRVVSFAVNIALGEAQDYAYTVSINHGSYYTPIQLIDETVPTTTIASSWTRTSSTTTNWVTSTAQSNSAPNSLFAQNLTTASDIKLETTTGITLPTTPMNLTFQGFINAESGYDGGVVEISTDNGSTWTDLGSRFTSGGYSGTLASFLSTNPIRGRAAFTGNSGGFVKSVINLASYVGQTIKIRFRFGSDGSTAATGWYVDDIQLKDLATVIIKSNLFNSINAKVATADTFTIINQTTECIPGVITTQPVDFNTCANGNATVTVAATGTGLTYQWKVSTDGGVNFTDITGATSATLALTNVLAEMNSNQYQCLINGTCTTDLLSNAAILSITSSPNAPTVTDVSRCGTGTVTLSGIVSQNETIDWYTATTGGTLIGTGVSISSPSISTTTTYYAQTRNSVTSCLAQSRSALIANILSTPAAPAGTGATICGSGSATLSAIPGANQVIDWYSASTGGTLLLAGSSTFTTPNLTATTTYFAGSRNSSCVGISRTAVTATVNALPAAVTSIVNATKCGTDTSTIAATASTGFTINWYADSLKLNLLQSGTVTGINRYITPAISSTTLYWAVQKSLANGCLSAASRRVTTTINPRPAAPSATPGSRCGTGTVVLRAVAPTNPAGTIAWYAAATGGTSLSTSTNYTTPSLTTTRNYFVEARTTATACVSATRTIVPATINAIPAAPTAVGGSRCGSGTVTISATPAVGLTADWYSAATGGTALLTGNTTYTTPSLTATRSYYAAARNAATTCVSATRRAVTATITSVLAAPSSLTGTTNICPIVGTATGTTYTTTAVTGATNYVWTIPSGAVIDSGSNGLRIKVRFVTAGANDSIFVQANNGCLGAKRVLKLVTTGCATTPFAKNDFGAGLQTSFKNQNNLGLSIYPNPTSNVIHLKLNTTLNDNAEVKILDLQGRLINTILMRSSELKSLGSDLKPGVYIIKVTQGNQIATSRFVKM